MPFENLLNISVKKDWVDYLSAMLTAMLTPTVAIFGLYIGYRQWRTEEAKLRHELFEKRYKQFDAVVKFAFSTMSQSIKADEEYPTYEAGDKLWFEIAGMRFIFNLEIEQYVRTHIIEPYEEIDLLRSNYNRMALAEEHQNNAASQRTIKKNLLKNLQTFQEKTLEYMQLQQPSVFKRLRQHLAALWEKIQKAAE
ncbi:hypothetical protein VU08_08760 [Desulfobulbus sp. F5]|nr:hypothetical protein [Desulfobulbus sp. F5]